MISATGFRLWKTKATRKGNHGIQLFAVSMADIDKALAPKKHGDPKKLLPTQYHQFLNLNRREAEKLPPHRGKGIDHGIDLLKAPDGRDMEVLYGPLYSMS